MAGYRTRRKTKEFKYIEANSTLKLPWAYSNSVDDYVRATGVFPEFFYNFNSSDGNVNMDIGVVFRGNNGWHLFANGPQVTNGWWDKKISLSAGQTISIAAYTVGSNVIIRVNGIESIISTNNTVAANIRKGCRVTREANLVPQKSENLDACWLLKTNAYFKGAVWKNTSITSKNGIKETMTTANTTFDRINDNSATDKTALDLNCISHIVSTESGYVVDECSIDFTQRIICK